MTDLIQRLRKRGTSFGDPLCNEAAVEIARLRAALGEAERALKPFREGDDTWIAKAFWQAIALAPELAAVYREQAAEIARLRAELAEAERALENAKLQLVYMHEAGPKRSTTEVTLARIDATLATIRNAKGETDGRD